MVLLSRVIVGIEGAGKVHRSVSANFAGGVFSKGRRMVIIAMTTATTTRDGSQRRREAIGSFRSGDSEEVAPSSGLSPRDVSGRGFSVAADPGCEPRSAVRL